jgi:hypothetical protein
MADRLAPVWFHNQEECKAYFCCSENFKSHRELILVFPRAKTKVAVFHVFEALILV